MMAALRSGVLGGFHAETRPLRGARTLRRLPLSNAGIHDVLPLPARGQQALAE